MSILIVDDFENSLLLFKQGLEEKGYVCHTAASGSAALEVLATEAVDLALIDVMMPGMTGLSLFQRLKELYPQLAVIFITGVDDLDLAVEHL